MILELVESGIKRKIPDCREELLLPYKNAKYQLFVVT